MEHGDVGVVVQTAADLWLIAHDFDTERAQILRRPNAREHEQLRCLQRARAQNDLSRGTRRLCGSTHAILDSDRTRALEKNALGIRLRLDGQIRRGLPREIRYVRAAALLAVVGHVLVAEKAFQRAVIEIALAREARSLGRRDARLR